MPAAIATPPYLFPFLAVDRKISPISSAVRLNQSHFKIADADEHYFSRKSLNNWDKFYKRHQNKFFKDRHYLEKDWGKYFCNCDAEDAVSANRKVLLEIGCGAGNTIFPLIAAYPELFVHACDFSPEALALVKSHSTFDGNRINLFLCDVSNDELFDSIPPASVDVVTLIFMLSAVSPTKMPFVLQNLQKVLKPNGHILLRDYATGDSAQFLDKAREQKPSNQRQFLFSWRWHLFILFLRRFLIKYVYGSWLQCR